METKAPIFYNIADDELSSDVGGGETDEELWVPKYRFLVPEPEDPGDAAYLDMGVLQQLDVLEERLSVLINVLRQPVVTTPLAAVSRSEVSAPGPSRWPPPGRWKTASWSTLSPSQGGWRPALSY